MKYQRKSRNSGQEYHYISKEHDQKSMILSIKNVCIAIFPVDAALQGTSTSTITTLISAPMRYHRNTELFPATIRRAGHTLATMDKRDRKRFHQPFRRWSKVCQWDASPSPRFPRCACTKSSPPLKLVVYDVKIGKVHDYLTTWTLWPGIEHWDLWLGPHLLTLENGNIAFHNSGLLRFLTSPSSCGFRSVLSSSVILITPSNQASCKWNISKCWSKQFQDLDDTFLFHHQIIPSCNYNYSSSSTERWIIINTCQRTWQSQIALTWASFALLNFRVENKESLSRTWTWMWMWTWVGVQICQGKKVDEPLCSGIHPLPILWHENIVLNLNHLRSSCEI